uniref:Uncharacterized protein n=1 Tax=viral metagenome TaxID=1070528 RepID=A0A6C0KF15_9ZZZZ
MKRVQSNSAHFLIYECKNTSAACTWAQHFVNAASALDNASPYSTVFDIDDTLIFAKTDRINTDVAKLYKTIPHAVNRVVVTARPTRSKAFSKRQLKLLDDDMPLKMFHMPDHFSRRGEIHLYKSKCRKNVEANSEILLNIGDQWTDVFGTTSVVENAFDLEESGEFAPDKSYVILPQSDRGREILSSSASVKLPSK